MRRPRRRETRPEVEPTHAYVARMPCCESVVALMVDDQSPSLGRELAKLVARGRRLERMTLPEARKLGEKMYRCECVPDAVEVACRRKVARGRAKLLAAFERRA